MVEGKKDQTKIIANRNAIENLQNGSRSLLFGLRSEINPIQSENQTQKNNSIEKREEERTHVNIVEITMIIN